MKICRTCHALNDDRLETCWKCGANMHDAPPYIPVVVYPNPHKASEREGVLLFTSVTIIILIFLIPVILGGFVIIGQGYQYDMEPNDTFSSAANVSLRDSSLKGFVNQYTDREDFYRFTFSKPVTTINFTLVFEDRNMFNITVYDTNTHLLNPDRKTTYSQHMRAEEANLERNGSLEDIYVRILAEKGSGEYALYFKVNPDQGAYSLWDSVSGDEGVTGEGKSFSSAVLVDGNRTYQAMLDSVNSPVQIYSISMTGGEFIRCNISKFTNIDLNVSLYDSGKNLMTSSFFSNDRTELTFPVQQTDTYYLVIRGLCGEGTVFITFNMTRNPFYDENNDMADATLLTQTTFKNTLNPVYDPVDWLKILMPEGKRVSLDIVSSSPLLISIMHDDGTVIREGIISGTDDIEVTSSESEFLYIALRETEFEANYSVFVAQQNEGEQHYILIVAQNTAYVGENITFKGVTKAGDSVNITWDFGDGSTYETGTEATHSFSKPENYTVTATRGDNGESDTYIIHIRPHLKEAIVIGISDYIESGLNDLDYCHTDAISWKDYLEPKGYNVTLMLNYTAKKDAILSLIQRIEKETVEGDTVLFIFSGHGLRMGVREFISPADSRPFSNSNDISDLLLRSMFMTFRSQHRFVFLDSCYSGGMSEVADRYTLFISATTDSELSIDSSAFKDGLWTYYFLKIGLIKESNTAFEDAFYAVEKAYTDDASRNYDTLSHPRIIDNDPSVPFYV